MSAMQRAFVDLPEGQVHLRYGGSGPLVLLLHQSPQSSSALLPLAGQLAESCTVIVPDTPGFGESEPLAEREPEIADLALRLHGLVEALGAERFVLFGQHTGGLIALEYALRHPERVCGLVIDGLAVFTPEESAFMLDHYLPPFVPHWDGGHLTWLWARLREQLVFFPWHDRRRAARLELTMPPPEALHAGALDFIAAGDHYRAGYGAAFRYRDAARVVELAMPAAMLFRADDPLAAHAERLPALPQAVRVEHLPAGSAGLRERAATCCRELARGASAQWRLPAPAAATERPLRRVITYGARQTQVLEAGSGAGLVLIPDTGRAGGSLRALLEHLEGMHVLVPDPPGCGGTAWIDPAELTPAGAAAYLVEHLPVLRERPFAIAGFGGGARVAAALARTLPEPRDLLLVGAQQLPEAEAAELAARYAEPIRPDAYGHHLTRLWQQLRDARLFFPWYRADGAHIRDHEPCLEPAELQAELRDALACGEAWPALWRARFEASAPAGALDLPAGTRLAMLADEPAPAACRAFAEANALEAPAGLPREAEALALRMRRLLGH